MSSPEVGRERRVQRENPHAASGGSFGKEPLPESALGSSAEELFNTSLGCFSESLDALRASFTVLERKCSGLNWALEETNRKLRESLEDRERLASRLDSILRCLSVGVLAVDLEGRLIEFNPAAEKITGYSRDNVLGTLYGERVGRGVAERASPLYTMDAGVSVDRAEKQLATATGDPIPVGFSTSLIKGEGGEIVGAVEAFTDLRQAKLMEEELLRARTLSAVGEMAAEVARQIRNPLAGLAGFAELLGRDLESDPERSKLVRKIQQGVAGVEGAIARLIESVRPLPTEFRSLDTVPIVERVLDLFEGGLEREAGITVVRRVCPGEARARANDEQLRQALWNVLVNARDAMPEGGTITASVDVERTEAGSSAWDGRGSGHLPERRTAGAFATIAIADTGEGMAAEVAEKAFSPFFTTRERRMGLGLTTVRRIVTGHGGEVSLDTSLGRGTTVTIRLPASTLTCLAED